VNDLKLVGTGSSMVVLVKYGVIVHAPNPITAAAIIAITTIVLFFNVNEFN
jgi:hypothetical protein